MTTEVEQDLLRLLTDIRGRELSYEILVNPILVEMADRILKLEKDLDTMRARVTEKA